MAYERGGDFLEDARKILNREVRGPRQSRFSIGSAPLTSITKSDAQISGGETRQDYKDTRRFPLAAPSCALLFLPFGLPVSFRCYGRVCLIPRLTLSAFFPSFLATFAGFPRQALNRGLPLGFRFSALRHLDPKKLDLGDGSRSGPSP